jgi:hypothetical protein
VIRQAISCDICASEKKQTNHWFVAYEQGGELRVSGWQSRNRLRPGSKHLCGQTCLHKLVDDFMARAISSRPQTGTAEAVEVRELAADVDTSLTSDSAYVEVESSARLKTSVAPPTPKAPIRPQAELVTIPGRIHADVPVVSRDEQRFASRNWRAEAWERERQRELRANEREPAQRRSTA